MRTGTPAALGALRSGSVEGDAFNLGNGEGFTVREVLDAVERVTGSAPDTRPADRRPGDPAVLVASSDRARQELHWKPEHPTLEGIVETAWNWHRSHPRGYDDRGRTGLAGGAAGQGQTEVRRSAPGDSNP